MFVYVLIFLIIIYLVYRHIKCKCKNISTYIDIDGKGCYEYG